jgi:hypothetical protein
MRDEAIDMLLVGRGVADEYLAGSSPQQDIVHIRALVFDFLAEFGLGVIDWAERSLAEVERWDDMSSDGKAEWALGVIEQRVANYP